MGVTGDLVVLALELLAILRFPKKDLALKAIIYLHITVLDERYCCDSIRSLARFTISTIIMAYMYIYGHLRETSTESVIIAI